LSEPSQRYNLKRYRRGVSLICRAIGVAHESAPVWCASSAHIEQLDQMNGGTVSNTYYVYSLKDPREKPAKVFYIGKGTGSRATDHLKKIDETRKGKYIEEMLGSGSYPIISKVVEELTEQQALQIELELISSFGTIDSGGPLYNTVIPKTIKRKIDDKITVPNGAIEKAQLGLKLLKDSIIALFEENQKGITNSDCAHYLGLQSDNKGNQQDYLTYNLLGLLLKEGLLDSKKIKNRRIYQKQGTQAWQN
jgi:hypothetical protein